MDTQEGKFNKYLKRAHVLGRWQRIHRMIPRSLLQPGIFPYEEEDEMK
jgi:hypothetical protein